MQIKSYGLMFEFMPTKETDYDEIKVTKNYVTQECKNFVLINYFKGEKKNIAYNADGFQTLDKQMYIELYMIEDTNPRKIIYDKKDDSFYRILETPINQEYNPSRKKIYRLPIEFISDSDLRFDSDFVRKKFDELWGELNAYL